MLFRSAFYIGNIAEAKKSFEAILAQDASHALALSFLGKIEADDKNYLRALEYIERAIQADDLNYDFYLDWGTYLRYRGKFEEAEAAWTKAIALDPLYFLAYVYRAELYDEQNAVQCAPHSASLPRLLPAVRLFYRKGCRAFVRSTYYII